MTYTTSVSKAIDAFKRGNMVIIVDDEDRENEGDLAMPADAITPEAINFMASEARGLICVSLEGDRLDYLDIPPMVRRNTARLGTNFTVSVDAAHGISTGISASDRSRTVEVLVNPESSPEDLARPGHIFPLRYVEGGVLVRAGQTEASVDLARMAKRYPGAVICEIMRSDGEMARRSELDALAKKHNLPVITVADIIDWRFQHENLVEEIASARLPTRWGEFRVAAFKSLVDPTEHVALVKGEVSGDNPVLVRVHSECLTGDVFGSMRCDCGEQTELALRMLGDSDRGVFLYMRQEGRGIGLLNKLKAYRLQEQGLDTVEANEALGFGMDLRHYGIGAQILASLGVNKINLLTNNPRKIVGLDSYGLEVVGHTAIVASPNQENHRYLMTKQSKMGHMFDVTNND